MLHSTEHEGPEEATPPSSLYCSTQHLAVLDADPGSRVLLCRLLRESGYDATGVESGAELQHLMESRPVDLVILDVMLPEENGFDICATLRKQSQVPVVIVSAQAEEHDRVAALDLGADDYIAKPFGRAEVLARVRAVLRRVSVPPAPPHTPSGEHFTFDGWSYRPRLHELVAPSGMEVELTAAEHDLLLTLLRYPQRMLSRDRLLELTRSRIGHATDRSVDMLVSRLRRRMRDGEARPVIRTIRGVGYMLAADVTVG